LANLVTAIVVLFEAKEPIERENSSHFVTSSHLDVLTSCHATLVACFLQRIDLQLDGVSGAIPKFLSRKEKFHGAETEAMKRAERSSLLISGAALAALLVISLVGIAPAVQAQTANTAQPLPRVVLPLMQCWYKGKVAYYIQTDASDPTRSQQMGLKLRSSLESGPAHAQTLAGPSSLCFDPMFRQIETSS
jgi:hypothetical protein